MKQFLFLVLSIISLNVAAQSDYYYYKNQRIPLIENPKKVNIISLASGPQYAPALNTDVLPEGLEVEAVIQGNPYNMCIIKNNSTNTTLLNSFVNSTINPNYNIALPCYLNLNNEDVIPSGYIYIKLKNINDIALLNNTAYKYRLNIDGASQISFPADYTPEIITVGSINKNGIRSIDSNYGNNLDVVAPGDSIYSTVSYNDWIINSGTSMAAPHVSGIAALILELNPDLTNRQVSNIIEQSTIKVGLRDNEGTYSTITNRPNGTWNQYYGYGLIDALKAVRNTPRKEIDY